MQLMLSLVERAGKRRDKAADLFLSFYIYLSSHAKAGYLHFAPTTWLDHVIVGCIDL